jgi:hypothetical protein
LRAKQRGEGESASRQRSESRHISEGRVVRRGGESDKVGSKGIKAGISRESRKKRGRV